MLDAVEGDAFAADASIETLNVTTLGKWNVGDRLNLEKALCAGQPLGGHYVTGHVDGIATVIERVNDVARRTPFGNRVIEVDAEGPRVAERARSFVETVIERTRGS